MKGDFHVRFCENTEVKFFCVTRLSGHFVMTLVNNEQSIN